MAGRNQKKTITQLCEKTYKSTHFSKREAESLLNMFQCYTQGDKFSNQSISSDSKDQAKLMDRNKFRDILNYTFKMTDDMLMDRVFRAFDKDNDSYISMTEWLEGLSIFLRGNLLEKARYCFNVYDLNNDGYISREEMFHMLKHSLVKQPTEEDPDEGVKDLVEITLKKMDLDHDSRLSYKDFEESVRLEELLLEAFGTCLPEEKAKEAFETLIEKNK
ncbi:calaxin-like [Tubulanus polymorphus]|uniref:calaxin-like n=1 Tax=Tubulanus polymorphus TaxID=672921 RepID=UPI003DA57173